MLFANDPRFPTGSARWCCPRVAGILRETHWRRIMVSKVGLKKVFAGFVAALALYAPVPSAGEQSAKTAAAQATDAARPALDYEFFKARVQPIFLKTRSEDHVRCYACHQVPVTPPDFTWSCCYRGRTLGRRSSLVAISRPSRNWWFPAPRSRACFC